MVLYSYLIIDSVIDSIDIFFIILDYIWYRYF